MSVPKEVLELIKKEDPSNTLWWYETIGEVRGKPCTRLYVCKKTKRYGIEAEEAGREYLDKNVISGSLHWCGCAGYQFAFDNPKRGKGTGYWGYYISTPDPVMSETTDFWYPNVSKFRLYDEKKAMEVLGKHIPHFFIRSLEGVRSVMEYAREYKESKGLEMLAKAGYQWLYKDKRLFKLTGDKTKAVVRWIKENGSYMREKQPSYSFIASAVKNGETGEECEARLSAIRSTKGIKSGAFSAAWGSEPSLKEMIGIHAYLIKQRMDFQSYRDYLEASHALKRNTKDRGVRFPKDLQAQHDKAMAMLDRKKNAATNKALKQAKKALERHSYEFKGLRIVFPDSQQELIRWGNALHNCVGVMEYGGRMAKGECIILGVFKGNKPVECCELIQSADGSDRVKVNQLRGDHNQDSEYHGIAEKLVNRVIRSYKSQRLLGACI